MLCGIKQRGDGYLKNILLAILRKAKSAYIRFLMKHLLAVLLPEIKETVMFVVARIDEETILDKDKREYAFQIIKQHCIDNAKEIPDRLLNLAIELAVNLLRSKCDALLERTSNK
ncbi:hypothetical protein GG496_000183 [Candidatus Fervidibacteria bacterium JGI MDM2 JNZ-1-D12]